MGKKILRDPNFIKRVLDLSCDTLFLVDRQDVCVDVIMKTDNPVFNPTANIIGENIISLLPDDTAALVKDAFEYCRSTGDVSNANYDLPTSEQVYYFKLIVQQFDEEHLLCQYRDITQRSNMKRRLSNALNALLEVGKVAKIGHWTFDTAKKEFLYSGFVNAGLPVTLEPEHVPLYTVLEAIHPEDQEAFSHYLLEDTSLHKSIEFRIRNPTGKAHYVRSTKHGRRLENNIWIIEGFSQNVTDFVKNRNELEMMLEVVYHAPYSIHAALTDGTIIFANKECRSQEKIPGSKSLFNMKVYDVLHCFKSKEEWEKRLQQTLETNGFLRYRCDQPYPDKNIIGTECSSFIIKNGMGEDVIWTIRRDISDQLRYEEQLLKSKQAAEESEQLKSAFISNMNHEIRTPLSAIIGFSNIIADTEDPELRKEYGQILTSNGTQLLRLVTDVLEMSSMDAGKVRLSPKPLSLNNIMHELKLSFGTMENLACLKFDIPAVDQIINVDRGRVIQLLTNLINNALKFTPPSGHIRVGYDVYEGGIEFYVVDNGIGIPTEVQGAIFDRFFKVNDADKGTGLGLAICKGIVEQMGGEIWVESEQGHGSTFKIRIPHNHS